MNKRLSDRLGSTRSEDNKPVISDGTDGHQGFEKQMIQRCVIIQRDEKGYGLTVSGESPVHVQSVKEGGAAEKAGVQQGDRIVKVNGSLVTNSNHIEVVKLIKSGPFVALTLLGRPPGHKSMNPDATQPPVTSPHSEMITAPKPVDEAEKDKMDISKVEILRKMRDKQIESFEKLKEEYNQNHSQSTFHKMEEQQDVLKKVDNQLYAITGNTMWLEQSAYYHFSPVKEASETDNFFNSQDVVDRSEPIATITSPMQDGLVTSYPGNLAGPKPWFPHSRPSHKKSPSLPKYFGTVDDLQPGDANLERSQSDRTDKQRAMSNSDTYPQISPSADSQDAKIPKTTSLPVSMSGIPIDGSPTPSPTPLQNDQNDRTWDEVREMTEGMNTPPYYNIYANSDGGTPKPGSPTLSASPPTGSVFRHVPSKQVDVICMEDDDFTSDDGETAIEHHGPFSDLNQLKNRPAHVAVFMHYLISNKDPCPLFFYLVSENFSQATGKSTEMRKWAYEIHSTFLVPNAPLYMGVSQDVLHEIDTALSKDSKLDKEVTSNIFESSRKIAKNMINDDLSDFRRTGDLGLGSLYGAHELQDENMDRNTELKIVEKYLMPHLERSIEDKVDRSQAMASSITTFLRSVGVTKIVAAGSSSAMMLERCPSFVQTKDRHLSKLFTKRPKVSKSRNKPYAIRNHNFAAQNYSQTTFCNHCTTIIWGIGNQGYQCNNCKFNCHKQCLELIEEMCVGPRKSKRSSGIMNMLTSSSVTHAQVPPIPRSSAEEAPSPSPFLNSQFHIPAHEDDDDMKLPKRSPPSYVTKTVSKFEGITKANSKSPPGSRDQSPEREVTAKVTRSESLTGRSGLKPSNKVKRHTKSDVDKDQGALTAVLVDQAGGSTSSSATSQRSLSGSICNSADDIAIDEQPSTPGLFRFDDSDMEVEPEMPPLSGLISPEKLKKLKPKEKKRQEVLNELFYTEKTHVRNLKVLDKIFYRPMSLDSHITYDLVKMLFPNLDEMLSIHSKLNKAMKARRKDNPDNVGESVADILLSSFDGVEGVRFKTVAAKFLQNQSYALEYYKTRVKKEAKLASFLADAESNPVCRRLQLKDLLPTCMHRLTKYPLLIENLLKYTSTNTDEYEQLKKCLECAKEILVYVNQAAQECDNRNRLNDLQKRMDKRPIENSSNPLVEEFRNLDLTKHKIIYDGPLTWRIARQRHIQHHVVLFEDILVLLQKQDEKLVLRCQSTTVVEGRNDTKFTHSPIIKLTNLLTRDVATDKKAFFLVSTSTMGPQIYELVAASSSERKKWFKYISEAAETHKGRDAPRLTRRGGKIISRPISVTNEQDEGPESEKEPELETESKDEHKDTSIIVDESDNPLGASLSVSTESLDMIDKPNVIQVVEALPLIQPSEVLVAPSVVTRSDSISLTPIELCKREDDVIKRAIRQKQKLVAEILGVPSEDFENIAEVSGMMGGKDPKELIMSSIYQANQLTSLVNDRLQPPSAETDQDNGPPSLKVTLGISQIIPALTSLGSNLTKLLSYISDREREQAEMDLLQQGLLETKKQIDSLRVANRTLSVSRSERSNSNRSRPNSSLSSISDGGTDISEDQITVLSNRTAESDVHISDSEDTTITSEIIEPNEIISPDNITVVAPIILSPADIVDGETNSADEVKVHDEDVADCQAQSLHTELVSENNETETRTESESRTSDDSDSSSTDSSTDSSSNTDTLSNAESKVNNNNHGNNGDREADEIIDHTSDELLDVQIEVDNTCDEAGDDVNNKISSDRGDNSDDVAGHNCIENTEIPSESVNESADQNGFIGAI